jgi:hypothetical protein
MIEELKLESKRKTVRLFRFDKTCRIIRYKKTPVCIEKLGEMHNEKQNIYNNLSLFDSKLI